MKTFSSHFYSKTGGLISLAQVKEKIQDQQSYWMSHEVCDEYYHDKENFRQFLDMIEDSFVDGDCVIDEIEHNRSNFSQEVLVNIEAIKIIIRVALHDVIKHHETESGFDRFND
ncbi:MAG: hypothetical protein V3V61_01025 [Gammaproteobacteria bacterium]